MNASFKQWVARRMGLVAVAGCLSVVSLQAVCAYAAKVEVNVATAYAEDNFQTQNLLQFSEDVKKITDGGVDFKVHAAGSLLKPNDIFSGVIAGKADAGEVIMSSVSKESPIFGIDSLPFIVNGYEDAHRLWDMSRPMVEKALEKRGLILLYAVPWPAQNLYADRKIDSVRDFKGLRMRNYSPSTERIAEFIGAKTVTIQVVDLASAIAADKLDVMITSSWTGVDTKAWTQLKYYYRIYAWIPKNMVFVDKKLFDKLSPDVREKIMSMAQVAEKRGWQASQNTDKNYESQLISNKVSVEPLDFGVRTYLDVIGEKLAREWLKSADSDDVAVLLNYTSSRSLK